MLPMINPHSNRALLGKSFSAAIVNNSGTFITSSLPLAAYLVASGELRMREVRLADPKRAVVVFEDEHGRGPALENQFQAGAVVSAIAFHMQIRVLRRAIDNELLAARSGVTEQEQHFKGKHHGNYASSTR